MTVVELIGVGVVVVLLVVVGCGYALQRYGAQNGRLESVQLRADVIGLQKEIATLRGEILRLERLITGFDRHQVKANLMDYFNMDEMASLLFDLDLRLDDFPHDTQTELVDALIHYCERHRCTDRLLAVLRQVRPGLDW